MLILIATFAIIISVIVLKATYSKEIAKSKEDIFSHDCVTRNEK